MVGRMQRRCSTGRRCARIGISRRAAILAAATVLFALCGRPLLAATNTWIGATGDWYAPANWSEGNYPQPGESVLIASGAVLLSNSTPVLDQFVITNATLTFTNWSTALSATNVVIRNNGKLTHAICNTNTVASNTNRVCVVATHVTIEAGGAINVDLKGWQGGPSTTGYGLGAAAFLHPSTLCRTKPVRTTAHQFSSLSPAGGPAGARRAGVAARFGVAGDALA